MYLSQYLISSIYSVEVNQSDKDIAEGFVRGNTGDYNTVQGWIRDVVKFMIWNEHICADDVVSDTTCKLLMNLKEGKFRHDSSLKTYVQSIARYTSIDTVRSRKRSIERASRVQFEAVDADDPLQVFEDEHELYTVDRILNIIDPTCVALWKMIFLENLTYKEIGQRIQITEGAVKTRVSRCKNKALAIRQRVEGGKKSGSG